MLASKQRLITKDEALPGRNAAMQVSGRHHVNGSKMLPPFPAEFELIQFGLGCFWGAERVFWQLNGVLSTAVGYSGGYTLNPTYEEVCSGLTGHTEAVLVVFDPTEISLEQLFQTFWQSHDPTQGMRQGNDRGTQYRSAIYCYSLSQLDAAMASKQQCQQQMTAAGFADITTEIALHKTFYYAEEYHQQYLSKNPNGYCGLGGTGVCYKPD